MSLVEKLFSMDGRLRRQDWWLLGIGLGVIQMTVSFAALSYYHGGSGALRAMMEPSMSDSMLMIAVSIAFFWPQLALSVKRRHDRGVSARVLIPVYAFATFLEPALIVLGVTGAGAPMQEAMTSTEFDNAALLISHMAGVLVMAIWLYYIVVLGFLDGQEGRNRYGPSPK